ncbi:MerR family transcriptional regulator [Caproicibacter fermentans]|uniref:Helix-turn-helix domain-containing protein n=1 Tax=Caproicibacter fermentans TaxID=2576756 RepID=A0A7G8T8A4_9FIRM|nr:helix-turn-helix domain-containing protein [Caproicibacter fermentans]QNK39845.1 helix-turn-helix domain-containing protein [Caproicibacter fermentans]
MVNEQHFREYLEREWAALPDALTACEVAGLLGYHRTTVNSWAAGTKSRLGKLPSIHYFGETVFAKEHLIAFLVSTVNIGFVEKSAKHRALIEAYRQAKEIRDDLVSC